MITRNRLSPFIVLGVFFCLAFFVLLQPSSEVAILHSAFREDGLQAAAPSQGTAKVQTGESPRIPKPQTPKKLQSANATLGFGGLFVVSGPGSPRREHLQQTAFITGLQLTIPEQIAWTQEDLDTFRPDDKEKSRIGDGSVKAWLSHHVVLKAFLASGLETALILEDDVDFDIALRRVQIHLAQAAARHLSSNEGLTYSQVAYPWSPPTQWDLLYLGHCGDYFRSLDQGIGVGHTHPSDLDNLTYAIYEDPTLPSPSDLHPFTSSELTSLAIPPYHRILHSSKWPLCSFGYAITRATAQALLTTIAPAKEDPVRNVVAYDVALLAACRDGELRRCYSLSPELFHHMEGQSMIAAAETTAQHTVQRPPVDNAGLQQVMWRGETSNVRCGFWSGDFWVDNELDVNWVGDDGNQEERERVEERRRQQRLEELKVLVGEQGHCLKEGREGLAK